MGDVKDILGMSRGLAGGADGKKEKKEKVKRPEGMSREAFALLQATNPIIPSHIVAGLKKKKDVKPKPKLSSKGVVTWQWRAFSNPARTDNLQLYHWTKGYKDALGRVKEFEEREQAFAKYNKKVQVYRYDEEEWENIVKPESKDWSREETDYLMDLVQRFDLRWAVVIDRFNYPSPVPRTAEDLKDRYYTVARQLLTAREGADSLATTTSWLLKNPYNLEHERKRRTALHLYLSRSRQQQEAEDKVLEQAKQIEDRRRAQGLSIPTAQAPAMTPILQRQRQGGARPPPLTAFPPIASSSHAAAASPVSPMPLPVQLIYPESFLNNPGAGVPSLFDMHVKPLKPPPGVHLRSAHTRDVATAQTNALVGTQARHQKAMEAVMGESGYGVLPPRMSTRGTSGAWLALRAEAAQLLDLRRNVSGRQQGDEGRKRAEKRKKYEEALLASTPRTDKRPRVIKKFD